MDSFFKAVIVDDEPFNTEILKKLLVPYKTVEVAGTATTVETALLQIMDIRPDLLFLDIELHDKNGLEWYKQVKDKFDWSMLVVIVSSHTEYGIKACLPFVFSFLVKPVSAITVSIVMSDFFKIKAKERDIGKKSNEITSLCNKFSIPISNRKSIIDINEIIYFEIVKKSQWAVICTNKRRLTLRYGLNAEMILAQSTSFIQINQKQIINGNKLIDIIDNTCIFYPSIDTPISLKFSRLYHKNIPKTFKTF
jgi:DNA-binding LytR/AlgR family response regulator